MSIYVIVAESAEGQPQIIAASTSEIIANNECSFLNLTRTHHEISAQELEYSVKKIPELKLP